MPEEKFEVKLRTKSGDHMSAVFVYDDHTDPPTLILRYAGKEITACEDDFFAALCTIRKQLESVELQPLCYGASRNVFPSRMSRDMGGGLKAYQLKRGNHAQMKDLVFIFDSGPDIDPASVAEQEAYYNQWLESLRR
jgi:hypothetical protein